MPEMSRALGQPSDLTLRTAATTSHARRMIHKSVAYDQYKHLLFTLAVAFRHAGIASQSVLALPRCYTVSDLTSRYIAATAVLPADTELR